MVSNRITTGGRRLRLGFFGAPKESITWDEVLLSDKSVELKRADPKFKVSEVERLGLTAAVAISVVDSNVEVTSWDVEISKEVDGELVVLTSCAWIPKLKKMSIPINQRPRHFISFEFSCEVKIKVPTCIVEKTNA